jgi:hypothetical protein
MIQKQRGRDKKKRGTKYDAASIKCTFCCVNERSGMKLDELDVVKLGLESLNAILESKGDRLAGLLDNDGLLHL